jgi:hypothetical protein
MIPKGSRGRRSTGSHSELEVATYFSLTVFGYFRSRGSQLKFKSFDILITSFTGTILPLYS